MNDLKTSRSKYYLATALGLGAIALVIGLIYWGVFSKSGQDDDYVNVPVNPPLIDVIITPEPLNLNDGAGLVTYTYKVTNPGKVTVDNVTIVDDKVNPVNYVSGDTNGDKQLQTNETWIYTSSMTLNVTTTNTATVKGGANGLTATDAASSTVVVTPAVVVTTTPNGDIPDTGTHLYEVLLAGVALTLLGAVGWRRRKRYE